MKQNPVSQPAPDFLSIEQAWLDSARDRLGEYEREILERICPRCEGSGEIEVNPADLDPLRRRDPQEDDIVRCPRCSGTGER